NVVGPRTKARKRQRPILQNGKNVKNCGGVFLLFTRFIGIPVRSRFAWREINVVCLLEMLFQV
ncbi:MAG: hypothetical protein Q4G59_13470, partial [Planctomycetia bacterium]|nr:hypothetical protein [Planctomycetia bacterium]